MQRMEKIKPEYEQEAQEIEILLSNDFEAMTLDELNSSKEKLDKLWGLQTEKRGNTDIIYLTESQRLARDFLWYRIKEEENKDDVVKIGDCFHTHWGYDQTNVEMFKVVGFTKSGKSAIIRQIGMKTVPGSESFMADSVQPDPDFEIKAKELDEHSGQLRETSNPLPDLRVRIERGTEWHPYKKERMEIGPINLRGSVYCAGDSKHLQNLYRIKKDGKTYRSWYA